MCFAKYRQRFIGVESFVPERQNSSLEAYSADNVGLPYLRVINKQYIILPCICKTIAK